MLSKPVLRALVSRATNWTLWDEVSTSHSFLLLDLGSTIHCESNAKSRKLNHPIQKARRQVLLIRKRPADQAKTRDETTVLDHLVHSDLVEKELGNGGFGRLAQLIQQAGAHNVSHTLGTIITYLLLEPEEKLAPLLVELEGLWVDRDAETALTWFELEKLPYLSACISEGLR